MPGDWNGRFAPAHEFVFHFNRESVTPAKTIECAFAGVQHTGKGMRDTDGVVKERSSGETIQSHKIPDSVARITRQHGTGVHSAHPAVFPVGLPAYFIEAFCQVGGVVYEPFGGAATTILAAEKLARRCFAMEIEPSYVAVALERLAGMGLAPRLA